MINNDKYDKRLVCSISGGSDSDIMLDIIYRCDKDNKVDYVWFDTGLEYQATKDHLEYLENKYKITVLRKRPKVPIPSSCKEYGQPFISKNVSEFIQRLQRHNFQWEDEPFEILYVKYPKCKSALEWWCNIKQSDNFNIRRNKYLKEFIIQNNPNFKISNKCCKYAKKDLIHTLIKEYEYDLNISGIRKAEGGVRTIAYKSCFDEGDNYDNFRPIFWYKDSDKNEYEEYYDITHSKCYTEYGLKRTGCCDCPYGRDFEYELEVIEKYEPKLYKAVNYIFKDSYEYTRKYHEFRKKMEERKMFELKDVKYEELEEMSLDKAKEIVKQFNQEDFMEDLLLKVDGKEYSIDIEDEGDWDDEGKYQYRYDVGILSCVDENGIVHRFNIAVTQSITRSGSYFSSYYYDYEKMKVHKIIQKTIPKQVIPERTVVAFED